MSRMRRRRQAAEEQAAKRRAEQATAQMGQMGSALTGAYSQGIQDFNPQAAFQQSMMGAQNNFRERFGEDVANMRGQQVGMGRLNTGFATADEDRLFRGHRRDMDNTIANSAMQLNQQEQGRLNSMGQAGFGAAQEAMSAEIGNYQTIQQARLQQEAERRRARGGLLSAGLGIAGSFLGGPAGGAIASGIGNWWKERG